MGQLGGGRLLLEHAFLSLDHIDGNSAIESVRQFCEFGVRTSELKLRMYAQLFLSRVGYFCRAKAVLKIHNIRSNN